MHVTVAYIGREKIYNDSQEELYPLENLGYDYWDIDDACSVADIDIEAFVKSLDAAVLEGGMAICRDGCYYSLPAGLPELTKETVRKAAELEFQNTLKTFLKDHPSYMVTFFDAHL